jgi:hypothetical protein
MSRHRLWRRLLATWRQQRSPHTPLRDRAALADELLETLSPSVLFCAGYGRDRGVRYARLRQGRSTGR